MADRRKALAFAGAALAAGVAGIVAGPLLVQKRSGAADLLATVFPDLDGQARRLLDWRGKVAVVNFWATWCEPCREEIPLLIALSKKYRPSGLEVVGIALDTRAKIIEFAVNYRISYPLLVGDARALDLIRGLGNQASALPFTVILDRAGAVAGTKLGAYKPGELDEVLVPILR